LYWARQGASVVGIDFSQTAIDEARRLARVTGADAEFVCADIYDLSSLQGRLFDIVYTSTGVLWWLPDLTRWAEVIAHHLKPGGFFYIHEIHPLSTVLGEHDGALTLKHDYFGTTEPRVYEGSDGTYYEHGDDFIAEAATECGWTQSLGDVVTALANAGLRIEFLHEHPTAQFQMLPCFEKNERNQWTPRDAPALPLTFSLRARK
jgi:SAM-dependent methyltransferase